MPDPKPRLTTEEQRDRLLAALEWIDIEDPSPTQMEDWILHAKSKARALIAECKELKDAT